MEYDGFPEVDSIRLPSAIHEFSASRGLDFASPSPADRHAYRSTDSRRLRRRRYRTEDSYSPYDSDDVVRVPAHRQTDFSTSTTGPRRPLPPSAALAQQHIRSSRRPFDPVSSSTGARFTVHHVPSPTNHHWRSSITVEDEGSGIEEEESGPIHWTLNDFDVGRCLGRGRFGGVFLARERSTGYNVAIKCVSKATVAENAQYGIREALRREISIQSNLHHPHIVRLFGFFTDRHRIYMLQEYVSGGNLFHKLELLHRFPDRLASLYIRQLCLALQHLHACGVLHRDIKPENLLLDKTHSQIKLCDFGYAIYSPTNRSKSLCGTLDYLPPEMVMGNPTGFSFAADYWAVGVLTYELLVGKPPFAETEENWCETYRRIALGEFEMEEVRIVDGIDGGGNEVIRVQLAQDAKDFVSGLLQVDEKRRMTVEEALDHVWLRQETEEEEEEEEEGENENETDIVA